MYPLAKFNWKTLPSISLIIFFLLTLFSCGGGSKTQDIATVPDDNNVLVTPEDYEDQPTYSGSLHAYRQDSDGDLVADIFDPAPSDGVVFTLAPFIELEFNNNIAEANHVSNSSYPFIVSAALTRGATYYLDVDYFAFNAQQGDRISVLLMSANVNGDGNEFTFIRQPFMPGVTLISSSGAVVTTLPIGDLSSGLKGVGAEIPEDGEYYVEVSDPSISATDYDYAYVLRVQQDTDFDGVGDALEMLLGSNPEVADSDGDGISDLDEILPLIVINPGSTDQGNINWWDVDGDTIVNWWDVDSDGDGPPDRLEGKMDLDIDMIANFLDTDANNNGKKDGEEVGESFQYPVDTDNDGLDDYMDFDADNDGIPAELDSDDTSAQQANYIFDDNALSILSVRTEIDDETTLIDTVLIGKMLWIDGLNFDSSTQVLFPVPGGSKAVFPEVIDADNRQLKVQVPEQVINGNLHLYNGVSLSNGYDIEIRDSASEPYIYPLQDRTQAGALLTLYGSNLSDSQVNVSFVNSSGTVSVSGNASGDRVTVTVPMNASSGRVSVETGGKSSNSVPVAIIDKLDAQIELPTDSLMSCSDIQITQFGLEKYVDAGCNLADIDVDNNSINFISIFYRDQAEDVYLMFESVVLPDDTSIVFNSLSTAAKLLFFNLGYQVSQPAQNWEDILDIIYANTDVQVLADRIDYLLQSDPVGFSHFTDATLVEDYQDALVTSSNEVAEYLATLALKTAAKADADITPSAAQHNVLLSTVEPADINIENETRVYLSVKVTDSSGKAIGYFDTRGTFHAYEHIKHPWDKNIIGPQVGGIFLISKSKDFDVTGRDSHFNITTGGMAFPREESSSVYQYAVGRTLFDGVAAPMMNKILEKIIGQKLQSESAAKIIVEVAGPTAWNAFVSDAINDQDKFFSAFNLYIATPIYSAVNSCMQLPTAGETCKVLVAAVAKHFGWTEYRIKTLIFKTVGKEIAAYLIPGVNVAKATYEMLDKINFFGTLLITGYDIGVTPGRLDFDVDFPLEIEDVKPMCLIKGQNEKLLVKGKGFLPYASGSLWWTKEVYPVAKLGHEKAEVKTVNPDGTSMVANFLEVLPFMSSGEYDLSVEHQGQTVTYSQQIMVAADGILLDSITPNRGSTGITVNLSGCGFSESAGGNSVWFSAESSSGNIEHVRAAVLASSSDSLTVVVPDDAITGDVYVTANGNTSNRLAFTVESSNMIITYGDNGYANDDTFSLYVDNALVSTMASPSRPFPVEVEMNAGVHTVKMLGITAPDDVGTYYIGFSSNVKVLSGPSQSGSDLTAGVVKSWQVEVAASVAGRTAFRGVTSIPLQPE